MIKSEKFFAQNYSGIGESCILCGKPLIAGQKYIEIKNEIKISETILYKSGRYHFVCIGKRNYFIAFLDILGFKQFVQNHALNDVYEEIQHLFETARASKVKGLVRVNGAETTVPLADLSYFAVSDSIIVYQEIIPYSDTSDTFEWKERAFGEFIFGLEELYKEALRRKIYLRGGISCGELLISFNNESHENIILGNSYIEAYELEGTQSWMGIAFHPKLSDFLKKSRFKSMLVEYQIPIKKECQSMGIPDITIGWIDSSIKQNQKSLDEWIAEKARALEIKTNTIEYFKSQIEKPPRIKEIGINIAPS
jgi:hypothetical protein